MLDKLPPELFSQVLLDIDDIRDLWSLCLVCREAQGKATPKLYQTLVIRSNDETRLENVDVKQYAAAASRPTGSLRFVQDLRIVSPFTQVRERCPHFMPRTEPQTTKGKKKTGRKPAAWPFTKCLSPILWKLKPNTLKSFSWQLGACLTQELFDYLTTNQLKIESLNLVTDPKCRLMKLRLKKRSFDAIRLLSWKGLDARNHGKLLLCILAQHNETLDSLELEKSEIWRRNIDASHDLGDSLLLAPRPETDEVAYPNLQHLSLYRFSLTTFRVEGVRAAFNLSNLRSLRLRHCLQPDALFTHAVLKKQEIRLTDLEFNWVSRFTALDPPELHVRIANINIFLQAFHGLEHLLIFTDMGLISGKSAYPHDIFAQGIVSHRTSLKQLSSRCFATATSYEHFHTDFSTYGDKVVANVASATGQKASILNDLDLEALSITALPRDKFREEMQAIRSMKKLRLLHVTTNHHYDFQVLSEWMNVEGADLQSGPAMDACANGYSRWQSFYAGRLTGSTCFGLLKHCKRMFGATGLPQLEYFAFGDFSNGCALQGQQILFARETEAAQSTGVGFRIASLKNAKDREQMNAFTGLLESCPEGAVADGVWK